MTHSENVEAKFSHIIKYAEKSILPDTMGERRFQQRSTISDMERILDQAQINNTAKSMHPDEKKALELILRFERLHSKAFTRKVRKELHSLERTSETIEGLEKNDLIYFDNKEVAITTKGREIGSALERMRRR